MDMPICPKCGQEIPQETNYCNSCGSPLQTGRILLQEKIVDLRHKETEAFAGCIVGLAVLLMGFVVRLPSGSPLSGFLNFLLIISGIIMMIAMAVFSQHYSNQRKNVLKGL
jgi:uncharacterized membrane protein YvbJ